MCVLKIACYWKLSSWAIEHIIFPTLVERMHFISRHSQVVNLKRCFSLKRGRWIFDWFNKYKVESEPFPNSHRRVYRGGVSLQSWQPANCLYVRGCRLPQPGLRVGQANRSSWWPLLKPSAHTGISSWAKNGTAVNSRLAGNFFGSGNTSICRKACTPGKQAQQKTQQQYRGLLSMLICWGKLDCPLVSFVIWAAFALLWALWRFVRLPEKVIYWPPVASDLKLCRDCLYLLVNVFKLFFFANLL